MIRFEKALVDLREPIREGLRSYQDHTDGQFQFDIDAASLLTPTPTKPNSARSSSPVAFRGQQVGSVFVIDFEPLDGTGDESSYALHHLGVKWPYPASSKVVPRNKASAGVASEVLLPIVRQRLYEPNTDPELFGGTFDLLGLSATRRCVEKIGEVGQYSLLRANDLRPMASLTVGNLPNGERFGDPHAVYNPRTEIRQVCAFIAINDDLIRLHPDILEPLQPELPRPA